MHEALRISKTVFKYTSLLVVNQWSTSREESRSCNAGKAAGATNKQRTQLNNSLMLERIHIPIHHCLQQHSICTCSSYQLLIFSYFPLHRSQLKPRAVNGGWELLSETRSPAKSPRCVNDSVSNILILHTTQTNIATGSGWRQVHLRASHVDKDDAPTTPPGINHRLTTKSEQKAFKANSQLR